MDQLPSYLLIGLSLGAIYAFIALGYTMVYGIIQLINFAHGEVVMIGCMVAFSVIVALAGSGMPPLVIVGIGNVPGAMLGGVLLGVVEALGAGYIGDLTGNVFGSNYQDVFAFIVLIAVLVLRPSGLLGERVGDRA